MNDLVHIHHFHTWLDEAHGELQTLVLVGVCEEWFYSITMSLHHALLEIAM